MKRFFIIMIYILFLKSTFSQSMYFKNICDIACSNINNINNEYTKVIKSNGFNFFKMEKDNNELFTNVFVKSYYNKQNLVKIELVDSLNLGRNLDIDIIIETDSFYIGTLFFWKTVKRNSGFFSSGFIINDKINYKIYLVERNYINFIIDTNNKNIKDIYPYNCNSDMFVQFVSSINILDKNLFIKKNLNFKYRKFISYCIYSYSNTKINKTIFYIKDKSFPSFFIEKFSITQILIFVKKYLKAFEYKKEVINVEKINIFMKNKPLWFANYEY